jgi:hypothetical protein
MAKSLRSKIKRRFRAEARASVGEKQSTKVLRKTTRSLGKTILTSAGAPSSTAIIAAEAGLVPTLPSRAGAAAAPLSGLRALLGGVGGKSAALVTLEPEKKKKLR